MKKMCASDDMLIMEAESYHACTYHNNQGQALICYGQPLESSNAAFLVK